MNEGEMFFFPIYDYGVLVGCLVGGNVYMHTRDKEKQRDGMDRWDTPSLTWAGNGWQGINYDVIHMYSLKQRLMFRITLFVWLVLRLTLR